MFVTPEARHFTHDLNSMNNYIFKIHKVSLQSFILLALIFLFELVSNSNDFLNADTVIIIIL